MVRSVASLSVTVPPDRASALLKHPILAVEHAALETVRRVFRWAELSAPVQHFLSKHHISVTRDIPYLGSGHRAHLLDVYRPREVEHHHRRPVVMYVHGGGFEVCSKDTHWIMAQSYARHGYVVFNVNYRLAPKYPFPHGLQDVCAAYLWLLDNAERFGGDPSRIVLAGESAGANLVSSLALINSIARPEPWAHAVFRRNRPPTAVVAACGLFEVSNAHRFRDIAASSWAITKRTIEQVSRAYLPRHALWHGEHDLADPVRVLEDGHDLHRPVAPFFVPCGTNDPLVHDSVRLTEALTKRGIHHEARYYDGEIHAFHAMWWRRAAKLCWAETMRFLSERLAERKRVPSIAA